LLVSDGRIDGKRSSIGLVQIDIELPQRWIRTDRPFGARASFAAVERLRDGGSLWDDCPQYDKADARSKSRYSRELHEEISLIKN
jgi:hypothetical protein